MNTLAAPTDQRAGVRPISFVLQNGKQFSAPVTLNIRPTDLTRPEPSRITVRQTLGRGVQGWVDNFGEGLPSVTIAGHTGWRTSEANGQDGVASFLKLNELVSHSYHNAKQAAINSGNDPADVKLLFVDMLDGFCWSVAPNQFVLQRSKSQPLLMKYSIQLQAVDTAVDNPIKVLPFAGTVSGGKDALGGAIGKLSDLADGVEKWVGEALAIESAALAPVAAQVKQFVDMSLGVYNEVNRTVLALENGISSAANQLITIASDLSQVGTNIFRTVNAIAGLPAHLKNALGRVAGSYNEMFCIFRNSLRPRPTYDDYTGLNGASNCSSTTGGGPASAYANKNAFALMQPIKGAVQVSSGAMSSISTLNRGDPVLAPIPLGDMGRGIDNITKGIVING